MNKTIIIHSKIPTNNFSKTLIPWEQVAKYVENIKSILPDNCIFVATPFDTTKIDGDTILINIDCKEYSYNELMEIIEKSQMYDNLCK